MSLLYLASFVFLVYPDGITTLAMLNGSLAEPGFLLYVDQRLTSSFHEDNFTNSAASLFHVYSQFVSSSRWCYDHQTHRKTKQSGNATLHLRPFAPCGRVLVDQFINLENVTWDIIGQKYFCIMLYFKIFEFDDSGSTCGNSAVSLYDCGNVLLPLKLLWRRCGHRLPWKDIISSNCTRY